MKNKTAAILTATIVYFTNTMAFGSSVLTRDCTRLGGQLIHSWQCPTSGVEKTSESGDYLCMVNSKNGPPNVFDGCSAPAGRMSKYAVFGYEACKRHDICYHNTLDHTLDGKHKCDLDFYHGMIATCKKKKGDKSLWKECGNSAGIFYQAVDSFGSGPFSCSDVPLDSSEYVQLYDDSVFESAVWRRLLTSNIQE
jgi:hypothetical protein